LWLRLATLNDFFADAEIGMASILADNTRIFNIKDCPKHFGFLCGTIIPLVYN